MLPTELFEELNDEIGPELVLDLYDPTIGMKGVVAVDTTAFGPTAGGIRMLPDVSNQNAPCQSHFNLSGLRPLLFRVSPIKGFIYQPQSYFSYRIGGKCMTEVVEKELKKFGITISKPVLAIICIVFGILVIVFKDLLQWIVGLFLIIQGVLVLTDYLELRK